MQTEQDLEKLVHAHTAALLRYCTGLLGCEADAQDAVQKPSSRHGSSVAPCGATAPTTDARGSTASPTAPRWICCGQPPRGQLPDAGTAGTGPRHQRRTAYRAGRSAATRPGTGVGARAGRPGLCRAGTHPRAARRLPAHTLSPGQKQLASRLREGEHHDE